MGKSGKIISTTTTEEKRSSKIGEGSCHIEMGDPARPPTGELSSKRSHYASAMGGGGGGSLVRMGDWGQATRFSGLPICRGKSSSRRHAKREGRGRPGKRSGSRGTLPVGSCSAQSRIPVSKRKDTSNPPKSVLTRGDPVLAFSVNGKRGEQMKGRIRGMAAAELKRKHC